MTVLSPKRNCWTLAAVEDSGVIIDAEAYYRVVHRAISEARRYVLMSGWQFNTDVHLLRGEDADAAELPSQLLPLLTAACERNPDLDVYILAWDFSAVFALEREWFQRFRFTTGTNERIHFSWDAWLPTSASHHQKLVISDGLVAFAGGMDVCTSRWDDRRHLPDNPLRRSPGGSPRKPYHDVQTYVLGPAVAELEKLFCTRWEHNTEQHLDLPSVEGNPPFELDTDSGAQFRVRAAQVGLSQTAVGPDDSDVPPVREIRQLYIDAVASAKRLLYIENQYFTSRSLTRAIVRRLKQPNSGLLQIVIVMPRGGDTPKEKFALGDAQNAALNAIKRAAEENGHAFRLFYSATKGDEGEVPTFIHAKVMCVDDRLLTVGSANATNRSFGLDSELNVTWEADSPELSADIARIRASLMAEHCGQTQIQDFIPIDGLTGLLDRCCAAGHRIVVPELPEADDKDELISLATDPEAPLDGELVDDHLDRLWESLDQRWFSHGMERLAAHFGKADATSDDARDSSKSAAKAD